MSAGRLSLCVTVAAMLLVAAGLRSNEHAAFAGSVARVGAPEVASNDGTVSFEDQLAAARARVRYRHVLRLTGLRTVSQRAVPYVSDYPGPLVFHGGADLASSNSRDIYVNCDDNVECWGDPKTFLNNLKLSQFIHITDQYVGSVSNYRYGVNSSAHVSYSSKTHTLYDTDMQQIVHKEAKKYGAGYGHIYHVFLKKGTDECFYPGGPCYSPDNLSTFVFCAYHSSVDFGDIGHVLYTVEPYQEVPGCGDGGLPHTLTDSTATALSHETFETITDPDGSAWFTEPRGDEIGDLCNSQRGVVNLNGTSYLIQPEFSNFRNDCVFSP